MRDHCELLAPAGNMEKLTTALRFGADAVYFAGPEFGLRAQAGIARADVGAAIDAAHAAGRKAYAAVNIFARNADFAPLEDYLRELRERGVDAVIVADPGVLALCRRRFPELAVHVSTQANTLNLYAARFYADLGVKRVVLARETTLREIREISDALAGEVELEAFVHGAMCIAYSGRCLISNYLAGRESNRGACVQACRWRYAMREISRTEGEALILEEDARGSYVLNSRDLNMLAHLDDLWDAGVTAFKIEGRMKTAYYTATLTNAYRRALDTVMRGERLAPELLREPRKASNRCFTTGFYYGKEAETDCRDAAPTQTHEICALVLEDARGGEVTVEMRNRFWRGLEVEVLSPGPLWNRTFVIGRMRDLDGAELSDAKRVAMRVRIETELPLRRGDILRRPAACVRPL